MTVRTRTTGNQPPTVTITTSPQTVTGGAVVALAATATDRDGSISSIRWSTAAGTLAGADTLTPTWTAPATTTNAQRITITCTVTDNAGATASVQVQMVVAGTTPVDPVDPDVSNQLPTVSINTPSQSVAGATPIALSATARDPDGTIASYAWSASGGSLTGATTATPTWTGPSQTFSSQSFTIGVTVTDNDGGTASDSITLTIGEIEDFVLPNVPPRVRIDTPAQIVYGGSSLQLSATATDPDGTVVRYAWTATLGTLHNAHTRTPTWTAPSGTSEQQPVTIGVTVEDNDGATASANVGLTVDQLEITSSVMLV